jgi:hypothetical protein
MIDLLAHGVQIAAPSSRRAPTARLYATTLTDDQLAQCRAQGRIHMTSYQQTKDAMAEEALYEAPDAESAGPEEEYDYPPADGVVRYALTDSDGDVSLLTFAEFIEIHNRVSCDELDQIRLLAPGETHHHGTHVGTEMTVEWSISKEVPS